MQPDTHQPVAMGENNFAKTANSMQELVQFYSCTSLGVIPKDTSAKEGSKGDHHKANKKMNTEDTETFDTAG